VAQGHLDKEILVAMGQTSPITRAAAVAVPGQSAGLELRQQVVLEVWVLVLQ
jgi:hypothetical protein